MRSNGFRVAVLAAAAALLPACEDPPAETPEAAFEATLGLIRAGEFDRVWFRLSGRMRKTWSDGVLDQKRTAANPGTARQTIRDLVELQYGMPVEQFLNSDPRALYAANLRRNQTQVVKYRLRGPARMRGDRAVLLVEVDRAEEPTEWIYVREDGRWLLDEVPGQQRR